MIRSLMLKKEPSRKIYNENSETISKNIEIISFVSKISDFLLFSNQGKKEIEEYYKNLKKRFHDHELLRFLEPVRDMLSNFKSFAFYVDSKKIDENYKVRIKNFYTYINFLKRSYDELKELIVEQYYFKKNIEINVLEMHGDSFFYSQGEDSYEEEKTNFYSKGKKIYDYIEKIITNVIEEKGVLQIKEFKNNMSYKIINGYDDLYSVFNFVLKNFKENCKYIREITTEEIEKDLRPTSAKEEKEKLKENFGKSMRIDPEFKTVQKINMLSIFKDKQKFVTLCELEVFYDFWLYPRSKYESDFAENELVYSLSCYFAFGIEYKTNRCFLHLINNKTNQEYLIESKIPNYKYSNQI